MKSEGKGTAGIGFTGALTVAFVVLKLCGVIDWPWAWVLSPIWIDAALVALAFAACLLVAAIRERKRKRKGV